MIQADWRETFFAWADANHIAQEKLPRDKENLLLITVLDLSFCKLTQLPDCFCHLNHLVELDLAYNELTEIPEWIDNFVDLEKLNMTGNSIVFLPDCLRHLPKLEIVGLDKQLLKTLTKKFNMKKNYQQKILFGSPGTGKSHRIDKIIIPDELNIHSSENIVKTVFHPEYTYGDFVGKLVPITRKGAVEYNFYEGHFLKALSHAYKNIIAAQDNDDEIENVALVIDEINRGNSAAIFGTIFQLLDREPDGWSSYEVSVNEITFMRLLELCELKPHTTGQYENIATGKILEPTTLQAILQCNFKNRTIKIPPNLSILASMNTSDSSIYYMDSAFKRRWEWEFIDVNSNTVSTEGIAFENRDEWIKFVGKLNAFIKKNHKSIRGIEDKQIGHFFITDEQILKSSIQNKLMFFLWDSVFNRDKKPLIELLGSDSDTLITFGDFAKQVDLFIEKISTI